LRKPDFDLTKNRFLSCDWGTSSFRLKLADLESGDIIESITTDYGIKKAYSEWQEKKGEDDRNGFFLSYLKKNIRQLKDNTENIPLIISGMASSNLGLKEMPYAVLPIDINPEQLNVHLREADEEFSNPLMLISGIRTENDVIRGEETQVFGMLNKLEDDEDAIIILPGTHSKHIIIRNNRIVDFKTYITGELFQLLSEHSILKDSLAVEKEEFNKEAFLKGIRESTKENILHSVFKIRAGNILHKTEKAANAAFLSGLLIGQELKALGDLEMNQLFVAGGIVLQKYYSAALKELSLAERTVILSKKEAEHLTLKGHHHILNHYQKSKS
jgi:2-dehydro-3-deoxygalactonokinase